MDYSPHSEWTEAALLRAIAADDASAFTEVYDRYHADLFARAKSVLQDAEQAADIIQDVFMSLWQKRQTVQIQSLEAYLRQSVKYMVFHTIRQGKAKREFFASLSYTSFNLLETEPLLFKELSALIPEILSALPEDQQRIFRMHREENMTYQQIAGELGISVKTVEKKMSLALRAFRKGTGELLYPLILIPAAFFSL